jgi:hypothetical protein
MRYCWILEFGRENAGPLFGSRCSRAWVGAPYAAAPNLAQGRFSRCESNGPHRREARFRSCPYKKPESDPRGDANFVQQIWLTGV